MPDQARTGESAADVRSRVEAAADALEVAGAVVSGRKTSYAEMRRALQCLVDFVDDHVEDAEKWPSYRKACLALGAKPWWT